MIKCTRAGVTIIQSESNDEFCVYLTVYRGGKLPPFYIGSTSLKRLSKGYCGSVVSRRYRDLWKSEVLNNRAAFSVNIIAKFPNRVAAYECERRLQKRLGVITSPLYANRSYGHKDTAGGWNLGVPAWNKGRTWPAETRARIRKAKSNVSAETRLKLSIAHKGLHAGDKNPARKPGVGAKISAAKKGVPLGKPSWHSGRTGVYSADVIEAMRARMLGKKNESVSAANKRRIGVKYRKRKDAGIARPHRRKTIAEHPAV